METTVAPPPVKHRKRINYALAGTLLHSGLTMDEIALRVGAANGNTLRSSLSRKGVTKSGAKLIVDVNADKKSVDTLTARVSRDAAEIIRDSIGERLLGQIGKLSKRKVGKLANQGQGEAAVLKTLAETHRTLYGGAEMNVVVFGAASLERGPAQDQPPAIDIESESAS